MISPLTEMVVKKSDSNLSNVAIDRSGASPAVVFSVLRKKLPVVHINDIEKDIEPPVTADENMGRSNFRIKLFNRNLVPQFPALNNESGNILKIKISP